jgi:hypothetical protein
MEKATNIGGFIKYLVQCEHQPMGVVNLSTVKLLHSTVVATPVLDKALIVTSGRYSSKAMKFAEEVGIELIDANKLIDLGTKAGFPIQMEQPKLVDNCFPISNKAQIISKLLNFLRTNLKGFDEQTTEIQETHLSLEPAYMVGYSINSDISTSVGRIIVYMRTQHNFLLAMENLWIQLSRPCYILKGITSWHLTKNHFVN